MGPLGYAGPALAASVATSVEILLLLWWLRKHLPGMTSGLIAWDTGRTVVAAAVMGGATWLLLYGLATGPWSWLDQAWFKLLIGAMVGGIVYLAFSWLLGNAKWLAGVRRAST